MRVRAVRWLVGLGARFSVISVIVTSIVVGTKACPSDATCEGAACGVAGSAGETGSGGDETGGSSSSTETGGSAGEGGSGAAAGSTSTGGSTGGNGGMGGAAGEGGSGGSGGCEPNGNTCENAAQGSCADVDDGCGIVTDCSASCGDTTYTACSVEGACQCANMVPLDPFTAQECMNLNGGTPCLCGGAPSNKVPPSCTLFAGMTWCCAPVDCVNLEQN